MKSADFKAYSVLASSTLAFTVCFMVWMVFAVLGLPIKQHLGLSETEFGILAATPVLSGSLIRVPLGIWTDRYGGRIVFFILMLLCVPAVFLIQYATQFWQFLLIGLWVGLVGGSFSVGTPYVARWFPAQRQGLAMGVFGAGNCGAAVNKLLAPAIIAALGWQMLPTVYAVVLLVTAVLFWLFTYSDPKHLVPSTVKFSDQVKLMKDIAVLRYSQYYSVVFGGYVGLSLWMVHYYQDQYSLSLSTAAFLAACFSMPGGLLRAVGGWFSDSFGARRVTEWVFWICAAIFLLLSIPQEKIGMSVTMFTVLLFVAGVAMAVGKASVFKFVSDQFPKDIGTVSGVVGLAGGLGGFLLPIMFGFLADMTGIRSSSFALLFGTVAVSLVWMYMSERKDFVRGQAWQN
ncbi:putative nitrate transporter NarT [Saezia sanguinis]|uniref:Putative nitrate transporter NarT n=1 Tax=Saezia sanguinis TaxID=1965230 RepID=A0A433SBT3_9BURK|nr:nitrate/nitrite transporter [Saezia sanguinis]RUS66114.1 putative nitrate transporter NarT [Saezia sanguinis]